MELTDTQVLAQLKIRRVKLKMELDRVEVAIKAFECVDMEAINMLDALPYMVDDINIDDDFAKALHGQGNVAIIEGADTLLKINGGYGSNSITIR